MRTRTTLTTALMAIVAISGSATLAAPQADRSGPIVLPPDLGDLKTPPTAKPTKEAISPERAAAQARPTLVGPPAPPAPRTPGAASWSHVMDFSHVLYDQPGDGSLLARGKTYKAQFAADGFTYVPFLGSDAPRNYPVKLVLQGIEANGKALAFNNAPPVRQGDRVVIDRGLVQEVYLLTPESVEQQFIFTGKPGSGDVVIRMAVQSDFASQDAGGMLRFANDLGGVTYSKAVTIDSAGRATDSPTSLVDGQSIEISLPESLLSGSAYPITVDPMINTFVAASTAGSTAERDPDIAYDATDDGYLIVWEHNFSATDGDIYSERYDYNGTAMSSSLALIDGGFSNWRRPRVANNNFNNNYLVVAEVGTAGARQVWGRTRDAASNTMGAQTQISDGAFSGDQFNADVGGDPYITTSASFYCVVWQRNLTVTDTDILGRMVTPATGATSGSVILIENSGSSLYSNPSISNSNNTLLWNVAYQFTASATDEDIYGSQLSWSGGITTANFAIDSSGVNNTNPAVSGAIGSNFVTVYEEDPTNLGDIYCRIYSGSTYVSGGNLTTLENIFPTTNRRRPSIDNNADHFMVAYGQQFSIGDFDPYFSVYCYSGGIRVAEQHRNLDYTGSDTVAQKVASSYSSGGSFPTEFMPAWDARGAGGFGEIRGSYSYARASCCKTDIVGDGATGVADLLAVINGWGSCPFITNSYGMCPGDIDGDLNVGVADLLSVIGAWGPCP